MSFFQVISDFFETLFNRNSPEIQKKQQLKKLESIIKSYQPVIFRNGNLLPNFAEAVKILYENAKPIDDILSSTISGADIPRRQRFEAQLVITGYTQQEQQQVESLSYEARKKEVLESSMQNSQVFEIQHRRFEKLVHELNNESFKKIDKNLIAVHQLADLCKFNFVTILQIFDTSFVALDSSYKPNYQEIPVSKIGNILEDLYFQIAGLHINTAVANAVRALAQLQNKGDDPALTENLKKIAYIINHIISPEKLQTLICFYKCDIDYVPKAAEYKESARQNFVNMIQERYKADEQRIKTEIKDAKIRNELTQLFNKTQLLTLSGYNEETDRKLKANSPLSFMWITPLQILKTFLAVYITEPVKSLLNDIVVEGFFNNPTYKSDFSATVYAALETTNNLQNFEKSFSRGQHNDLAVLDSYLKDSHKDSDFFKKMKDMVTNINNEANRLITKETNTLNSLYKQITGLLQDAKKPTSEIVSNLKVLMMSSRNRDNTDLLEQQYPFWENFFEIMKNYAIISVKEIS